MAVPVPVIVNRHGGAASALGAALPDRIVAAFAAAGQAAEIYLHGGAEIADAVRAMADRPLVVVGGDGTIGCAAQARVESGGAAMGLLPLGTRNHLVRELGIPLDLEGAVAVAVNGIGRRIDLAHVNGHAFVNNASVGFYPLLVRWRDAEQELHGLPKWLATIRASGAALRRLKHHRMYLRMGEGAQAIRTPLLFVGNNRYTLERGRIGQRESLDDGTLSVFAVAARSRSGLAWFAIRALLGLADPERDFAAVGESPSLTVDSRSRHIDIALDGEVRRLVPPLRFGLTERAFEVRAPA